jgi:hypothetical protein
MGTMKDIRSPDNTPASISNKGSGREAATGDEGASG